MSGSGGNKCSGCSIRIKKHKFGKWGPNCQGPPGEDDSYIPKPQDNSDLADQLKFITERLKNLETRETPEYVRKVHDVHDEVEPDFESMSREQMVVYMKNANKDREKLAGSGAEPFEKLGQFEGRRNLSIPNLFDNDYHRQLDADALNLRKAADTLKEKHSDRRSADNRIPGTSVIDDLRRDPRLVSSADDFLRDAGQRAPWLQTPTERDEYLVRNILSASTVSYAGIVLQKEITYNSCNLVGALFYLKNALLDGAIKTQSELFSILSHYEHVFTCTANGASQNHELNSRSFKVALQYDQKVSSSIDAGITSWDRLGEGLHAEYMLQAKDIVDARERKSTNHNDRTNHFDRKKSGNDNRNGNGDKVVIICGNFNDVENEEGKCTWSAANNKNCRFEHSCRTCWNTTKQLNNHRELDCRKKSGQPFLDNGGA